MRKCYAKLLRKFATHSGANYKKLKSAWKELGPHAKIKYIAELQDMMWEARRRAEKILQTQAMTRRHAETKARPTATQDGPTQA